MARGITEAFIDISPDFTGFAGKLSDGLGFAFGSALSSVGESFTAVGKTAIKKFSIPLAVATAANIAQFQALEAEINTVLTLFGTAPALIDETFGEMSAGIREVATEVGGLEKDIAGGLYQAISAGVPESGVFEFLEVAQMAAMADRAADLETAVDGISTAVNAFSSENLSAGKASDILFAGVAVGKTTLDELGSSIGKSAGLAANAGVKFGEFIAVISEMTKSGLATSEAVSNMRAAITGLLRPSDEMNAIFQEIGFASAEAAIPVIGLQGAMETVSVAAGGSTSKLQELLGSSEAVTAVLAVTGEKAEAFAGTLNTVQSAAGNTERAYDIMQRGIGRSFGRLTESFDRLGNLFGEMGSKIVKPFIDILGDLVSSLVSVFQTLTPMAVTLGKAVEAMLSVFDIPIVGAFAKGLVIVALAMSGILGVLAPLIFGIGQLIRVAVGHIIIRKLAGAIAFATKTMAALEVAMARNVVLAKILMPLLSGVEKALKFVGIAAGRTALAISTAFLALAVFAAAAFVAIKVFTAWREAAEEAAKAQDIFGDGVSRLLDNAGIVENDLPKAFKAVEGSIDEVRAKNFRLIAEFRNIKAALGPLGAGDVLVNIGASLVWKGATPEQAWEQIQQIGRITGLDIPISFESFLAGVEGVEILFDGLRAQAGGISDLISDLDFGTDSVLTAKESPLFKQMAASLAEALIVAESIGELPMMRGELEGLQDMIGDSLVMGDLLDEVFLQMEKIGGEELGISLSKTDDVESFFKELENLGKIASEGEPIVISPGIDTDLAKDLDIEAAAQASLETLRNMPPAIAGVIRLTGDQGLVLQQLMTDMDTAFAAANEHIQTSQDAITASLEAQIPVFAEYTAAVALSVDSLGASADAWSEDLAIVAEGSASLAENLTPAEIKIFNEQSIKEQAGFFKGITEAIASDAKTGKDTVGQAWEDLGTLMSIDNLGEIKIGTEIETIMAEARTILNTGLTGLITDATEAGVEVPASFLNKFNAGAIQWGPAAQDYWNEVEGVIGENIAGPTITAPTFIGGSTTYTVNVTASNTPNPGKEVSRALQRAGGQ